MDALEGPGSWKRIPAATKQELRDNAYTLLGRTRDDRPPFSKADAEAIKMPTLFIGSANSKGALPLVLHTGGACEGVEDRDNSRHHASDVRTSAAEILRDHAGVSGGVISPLVITCSAGPPWMPPAA
jgi:hypothetical protein